MRMYFGKDARKVVRRKDLAISFQYVWNEDKRDEEECLVFARHADLNSTERKEIPMYVLAQSALWKYTGRTSADNVYLVQQAMLCAQVLGFEPSKYITHQIIDAFQWGIIELLGMKPLPNSMRRKAPKADVNVKGSHVSVVLH